MSEQVPVWFRDQWAQDTILRFQNRGYVLKGTTQEPVRIEGDTFYFLRTGSMVATSFKRGDDHGLNNPDDDKLSFKSTEWDAAYPIYDWDVTRLSVKEQDTRKQQAAAALGRKADEIIYDAIMAPTLPAGQIFGDYTKAFDPYELKKGLDVLADNDAIDTTDGGMIFAPIPTKFYSQLETYQIFANSQWVGPENMPLAKLGTKHKTWDTAHCFQLPPHLRKKYTASTTQCRFRIWNKSAIGAGHNEEMRMEPYREGRKKRWIFNHTIDGCALALQTEGIVEFRYDITSAIAAEIQPTKVIP